jgi:hypothetical protein
MERHKYVPVARLPRKTAFINIMKEYTQAYRVSDDPVWRDVPVLQARHHLTVNGENPGLPIVVTALHHGRVESFEVERYLSPFFNDGFSAEMHLTHNKRMANEMFRTLISEYRQPGDLVLVLDSPAGQTVRMLHKTVPAGCLLVANPDTNVATHLYKYAMWYNCTALEFIRDYPHNHPTHYWLDYCCTFDGCSTKTLPKLDIEALFCRGDLPRYNGVLCLTFSMRCYQQDTLIDDVHRFIRRMALKYSYYLHMVGRPFVYNRIIFFRFISQIEVITVL